MQILCFIMSCLDSSRDILACALACRALLSQLPFAGVRIDARAISAFKESPPDAYAQEQRAAALSSILRTFPSAVALTLPGATDAEVRKSR
jgi:hypothetical protein